MAFVYLLGDTNRDGVFKIGVTRGSLENRIKKLQTGNSGDIYIVNYYETEHPFFIEKWMHIKHVGQNVKNEWFEMSVEDLKNFKLECKRFENLYKVAYKNKKPDI